MTRASDVLPEPISWLWKGWLAADKMHVLGGAPGAGKTTIASALAATVSTGGRWPDGARSIAGNVVVWSGEDDPADTLIPRLALAGANLSRVYFVTGIREGNERLFHYRFGFSATRAARRQVIAIQQTYDLSDSEIRWLKHAGHLRISRTDMTLDPSRLLPVTGWIQLTVFSIVCIAMIFQVAFSGAPAWKQGLGLTILAAIWFAGAAMLFKLYVVPWNTLKRSGAIAACRRPRT